MRNKMTMLLALHPSYRHTMWRIGGFLLLLAAIQLLAWLSPNYFDEKGIPGYLPLHTLFETSSVVISMMVFAVGWNTHSRTLPGNIVLLACLFFAVGWLDFAHTISYRGMPEFYTPNDGDKQLQFWLAARLMASVALFVVATRAWQPLASYRTRYLLMGTFIAVSLLIYWLVLFHQDELPRTFVTGQGLTAYKKNLEYIFIALNAVTALLFWKKMGQVQPYNVPLLFAATCVMGMGEFFFTLYTTMVGGYNVLGHVYKVISYLFIYRAIVVETIEVPYKKLAAAQNNLSVAIHASNTGLWDWDLRTNTLDFSEEWKAQLGYQAHELANAIATWEILLHPEDRDAAVKRLQEFIISPNMVYESEYRMRHHDGSYRWILARGEKSCDSKGETVRLVGSHTDITHIKRNEEELVRYKNHLEEEVQARTHLLEITNRELEAFSYSVSHDLRAPLRGIDGFSQMLMKNYADKLDDKGKDYLTRVRRASQRMGELIDDMLMLSRVTRSELNKQSVDLRKMAQEILAELSNSSPERKVEIQVSDGVIVYADAKLMRIVLENLLGNAWKFTGKQAEAKIEFGMTTVEGVQVAYVRDNGAGFNMAYAGKLFGAFQRLHGASEFEGTGIGLATVQRIIRRHGGRVWAEGAEGAGATFYFTCVQDNEGVAHA